MATYPQGVDMAAAIAAGFVLDRREAVPALIGRHEDFLFVTGLAGTARDIAALTHERAYLYDGGRDGRCRDDRPGSRLGPARQAGAGRHR